jgi:hypothetical protein
MDEKRVSCVEMKAVMEAVAVSLRALPPEEWAGWVIYLLELLDGDSGVCQHQWRRVLMDVTDAIEVRARCGRW